MRSYDRDIYLRVRLEIQRETLLARNEQRPARRDYRLGPNQRRVHLLRRLTHRQARLFRHRELLLRRPSRDRASSGQCNLIHLGR